MTDYSKVKFILPEILNHLRKTKTIDDERIAYFPEEYPFLRDDFYGNFVFLNSLDKFNNVNKGLEEAVEERSYFLIDKTKVILTTICGQGCFSTMNLPSSKNKNLVFKREYCNVLTWDELEKQFPIWKKSEIKYHKDMAKAMRDFFKKESTKKLMKKLWPNMKKVKK